MKIKILFKLFSFFVFFFLSSFFNQISAQCWPNTTPPTPPPHPALLIDIDYDGRDVAYVTKGGKGQDYWVSVDEVSIWEL